jgi:hypothetical protein
VSCRPMYYMPGRKAPPEELNPYYGFEGEGRMLLGARDREDMKLLGLGEIDYSQGVPTETGTGGLGGLGALGQQAASTARDLVAGPNVPTGTSLGEALFGAVAVGAVFLAWPHAREAWHKAIFIALGIGGTGRVLISLSELASKK